MSKAKHVKMVFYAAIIVQLACVILGWTAFGDDPAMRHPLSVLIATGSIVAILSSFALMRALKKELPCIGPDSHDKTDRQAP